jgi:hypothetical protein
MDGMPKKPSRTISGTSLSKLAKQTRILPGSPLGHHHHFHRGRASTCFALPALLSRVLDGDWSAASFFLWTEDGVRSTWPGHRLTRLHRDSHSVAHQ